MDERYTYCFQPKAMVTDNQGRSSAHAPNSAGIGFSQPLHFGRYMGEERGRPQHQHIQSDQHGLSSHPPHPHHHSHSHPHHHSHSHISSSARPHELREAIYIEIEKERIRQEIIMSEIRRRRAVEAEAQARRKIRIEREFSLGSKAFTFGSQSSKGNCYHH